MSNSYSYTFRKLTAFLILVFIYSNNFSAFAQTRRAAQTAANNTKQTAQKCSGAWTGTITYTRTQSSTSNKTVERVSARGQDTTNFQMNYNYKAQVSVQFSWIKT